MLYKYAIIMGFMISNGLVAMDKPLYQPPFKKNKPIRSTTPRPAQIPVIQVESQDIKPENAEHVFDYFKNLAQVETELNKMISNAKDYHTGYNSMVKILQENRSLSPKDKDELHKMYEKELDTKFFSKEAHSGRGLVPTTRKKS